MDPSNNIMNKEGFPNTKSTGEQLNSIQYLIPYQNRSKTAPKPPTIVPYMPPKDNVNVEKKYEKL